MDLCEKIFFSVALLALIKNLYGPVESTMGISSHFFMSNLKVSPRRVTCRSFNKNR